MPAAHMVNILVNVYDKATMHLSAKRRLAGADVSWECNIDGALHCYGPVTSGNERPPMACFPALVDRGLVCIRVRYRGKTQVQTISATTYATVDFFFQSTPRRPRRPQQRPRPLDQ